MDSVKIGYMMNELREMIESRRKELNISKKMLSEMTGYGRHPYNAFMQGVDIQLSNFLLLCEALGIEIAFEINRNIKPYEDRPKGGLAHKGWKEKQAQAANDGAVDNNV